MIRRRSGMTPIAVVSVAALGVLTAGSLRIARIWRGLSRAPVAASTTPWTHNAAPAIIGDAPDVPPKLLVYRSVAPVAFDEVDWMA
jgi:hypothetical protein